MTCELAADMKCPLNVKQIVLNPLDPSAALAEALQKACHQFEGVSRVVWSVGELSDTHF
jgi:hypothetical protein